MFIVVIVGLIALGLLGLGILGYFLTYCYFFPEDTPDEVVKRKAAEIRKCEAGTPGEAGADGKLNEFAISGPTGPGGVVGAAGKSGAKNLNKGRTGRGGFTGLAGPIGTGGNLGNPGLPSNSVVPYVNRSPSNDFDVSPEIFTHKFTYEGVSYDLTSSFLFEEIGYFSFLNGAKNKRFKIKTSNDPGFEPITDGEAKKIYSTIRIILERKDGTSDGVVFYESPPIVKDAFLISSTKNLNYSIAGNNLQELLIDQNRDFGLDFEIEADTTPHYSFILGGLARYRAIVNIDPFTPDIVPRIEERYSNQPITEFASHTYDLKAKGNIIRIKAPKNTDHAGNIDSMTMVTPEPKVITDIYTLSPRLDMGRVIFKDSTNAKSVYKIEDATRLADTINPEDPPILQAIEALGEEANKFSGKTDNFNRIVAIESYSAGVQDNLLVGFKGTPPNNSTAINNLNSDRGIYMNRFVALSDAENALSADPTNPALIDAYNIIANGFRNESSLLQDEIDSFNASGQTNMDAFFTRTTLKNLQIDYPIDRSPLTYPSGLEGSYIIIKFILKVSRKNFTNFKYFIYNTTIDDTPIATVESSKSVIYRTRVFPNYIGSSESLKTNLPVVFEEQYLYSEISLGETTNENLFFENFYGRTIILKFSEAIADLQLRYRGDNMTDTFDTPPSTRFSTNPMVNDVVFEDPNDDYGFTDIGGWDAECQVKELEVELDNFVVGYFKDGPGSNPMGQRVKGIRRSNGDYLLTIPLNGYNNII